MDRISPIYHPTRAKDYINVTNNLNPNDTIVWYDSENPDNIAFPSVFTYKKTNSWYSVLNLKLSKVVLNASSGNISSISPTLPSSQGTFNATLRKEGDNPPTMDLYFQGNILYDWDYDSDYPEDVGYGSCDVELTPDYFPSSGNMTVKYGFRDRFVNQYYEYKGDKVTITNNWNNQKKELGQANGVVSFSTPSENLLGVLIPKVYIYNWVASDYIPPSSKYEEIDESYTIRSNTNIRQEPYGGEIIDSIPAEAGDIPSCHFSLKTKDGAWYYADFILGYTSGWVSVDRIY